MIKKEKSMFSDDDKNEIITPDPDYKIQADDTLVLFGSDENIENLKKSADHN